jgi:hypothetical protein
MLRRREFRTIPVTKLNLWAQYTARWEVILAAILIAVLPPEGLMARRRPSGLPLSNAAQSLEHRQPDLLG